MSSMYENLVKGNQQRAKKLGLIEHFTEDEWIALLSASGMKCAACKKILNEFSATADHVIPLVKGGTNKIDNIQVLCKSCNCAKHDKVIDFRNTNESVQIKKQRKPPKPLPSTIKYGPSKITFNLQSIAESKGFNMSQVQRQSGLTMGLVRRYWYNETEEVKLSALAKLCALLNCTPGDLIQIGENTTP